MPEPLEPIAGPQPAANAGVNEPPHDDPSSPTQVQTQVQGQDQGQQVPNLDALFQQSQDEEQDQGTPFDADIDPDATPVEVMRKVSRHFSYLLVPFLFALVTFLLAFLFLVVLKDNRFLPPSGLWSIGLIVLALAVLQGMLLYYSGTNNGYWFLSLLLGFVIFPAALFFAIGGLAGCLIVLVVMSILCGVAAKFSMHQIQDGHVGLVYSFGKYRRTLSPGMNFLPPWEHISYTLDTRETQWTCSQQTVPMSPKDDLALAATIAYHIIPEDAHYAVQQVNGWETQLRERFRATVQSVALQFRPEDFYAWQQNATALDAQTQPDPPAWNRMNSRLFQIMRDLVSAWGVQVKWVRIHDVTPLPHVDRAEAMRAHMNAAPVRPAVAGGSRPGTPASQAAVAARGQARPQPAPAAPVRPASAASSSPAPIASAAPVAPAAASNASGKAKDEALLKAYEAVRNGSITDPETIRRIAGRFDAISHDSVANHSFPFDAQRAARNLYEQARYHEDRISASAEYGYSEQDNYNDPEFDDFSGTTEANWERPPNM